MATGGVDINKLSDETFDLLCTMCKRKGRNREADKYCTDCSDYYCLKCVKVHEDVPSLTGHKILDKGQFQSSSSKPLPMVPTERCDKHGHKSIDMYCQNHDEVGCPTCMAVEHRSCQDIFYIPEFIQNNASTPSSRDILRKLEGTEKLLVKQICEIQDEQQNTLKRKAEVLENVRKFREEINKRLDEMERKSIDEVNNEYEAVIKKIEGNLRNLQKTKQGVTYALGKLSSTENNISQAFVDEKKGQSIANEAVNIIDKRNAGSPENRILFKSDEALLSKLQILKCLGKVVYEHQEDVEQKEADPVKQTGTLKLVKAKKKYSVRIQSDKADADIITSCFLKDGTVILGDYRNGKLKRLNKSTFTVRDNFELPGKPWQVCTVSEWEVAVSYLEPEILIISLNNKMKTEFVVKTDFKCYGLAYADGNLYISDSSPTVYVFSKSGRKLRQFSHDRSGKALFHCIFSLAVSADGSKIYVADSKIGVLTLDNKGHMIGKYDDRVLQSAYDACLATNGTVFVCGKVSNNVLQFGPNCEPLGQVVQADGGYVGCQTICCCQDMTKLIVGRVQNEIEVYDLMSD